jgi:hypothetical protein
MTIYSFRPITEFRLPAVEGVQVLYPEQTILKAETGVDIGALCYLKRSNERREKRLSRKVALDSYDASRAACIQRISNKLLQQSAAREITAATVVSRGLVLIQFLDWCDVNGHERVLESVDAGRAAFRGFAAQLRQLFDTHGYQMRSIYTWQKRLISLLNQHFEIPNIDLGANLVAWDRQLAHRTEVPTEDRFGKFLSLNQAVFSGICDLILGNGRFPYAVEMPEFARYPKNKMWLFPSPIGWAKHPESLVGDGLRQAYDYVNGRIKSYDEVFHLYSSKYSAEASIQGTQDVLAKANDNHRAAARIRLASLANDIFLRLFGAITGANLSDIERIEWTEELAAQIAKPEINRQGFRSIKVRANNRQVFYQMGVAYLPLLRKFIELRAWLLQGTANLARAAFFVTNFVFMPMKRTL